MKYIFSFISLVFHPVFILYYIFLCLYMITPVEFIFSDDKQWFALNVMIIGMSIFFPTVSLLALRASGLVSSIRLEDPKQRIGPMIASIIFYVWLFLNYRQFDVGPKIYEANILGATMALCASFFVNNFSKISLHSVGVGGLVGAAALFRVVFTKAYYILPYGDLEIQISPNIFLSVIIVIAGLVGTVRLFLRAHRPQDVYGGFLIGFVCQLAAFKITQAI